MLNLLLKRHRRHRVVDVFQVCCAKGFRFDSHLCDFRIGSTSSTFQFMRPLFLFFFHKFMNLRFRFSVS